MRNISEISGLIAKSVITAKKAKNQRRSHAQNVTIERHRLSPMKRSALRLLFIKVAGNAMTLERAPKQRKIATLVIAGKSRPPGRARKRGKNVSSMEELWIEGIF